MSLNPFDNASEQAQAEASEASEIVLASVEAVSDDGSVVAVTNVGKEAKYPARVPRDLGILNVNDAVLVNTAVGGQPFVISIIEQADGDDKVGQTVDVSDSGTSVLENASELNFDTNLSVSESDGTATIDASGGGTSAIVDKYKHIVAFFGGTYVHQPTENNLFERTNGYLGDIFQTHVELVYDNENDRVFSRDRDDGFYELPTSLTSQNSFGYLQSHTISNFVRAIGYDPSNNRVITSDDAANISARDPTDLSTTVWSSSTSNGDSIRQLNVTDTGDIYGCTTSGNLYHFDSSGTEQDVDTNGSDYRDVAVGTDGNIHVVDYGTGELIQYDSSFTKQWTANTLITPTRCGVGTNNSISIAGEYGIERYDSAGTNVWQRSTEYSHFSATVTPTGKLYSHTVSHDIVYDESDGSVIYRFPVGQDDLSNSYYTVMCPRPAAYPNEWT